MKKEKIRLDTLLVELGFFDSKEKAQTCIMSNGVYLAGTLANKAGKQIDPDKFYEKLEADAAYLRVEDKLAKYVSRGALKLEAAHKAFNLDFTDKVVLDIGASTGGFTDYSLQHGAKQVIALDVGHGQLHYKLQNDPRVINLEGVNFRNWDGVVSLPGDEVDEAIHKIALVVIDVSFISLITILEKLKSLCHPEPCHDEALAKSGSGATTKQSSPIIVALIKPQFEAGKEIMDKCQGVIKDDNIRKQVLDKTLKSIEDLGYKRQALIESPIKGAKGNVEYLVFLA